MAAQSAGRTGHWALRLDAAGKLMGGFPIESLAWILVAAVSIIGGVIYSRRAVAAAEVKYARHRVGDMAHRLRLHVTAGDPRFNLVVQQEKPDVFRGLQRGHHVEVRLQGSPLGQPLEFVYIDRVEHDRGFMETTTNTLFECCMAASARQPFPPFEVISRYAPQGPINSRQALPPMLTGRSEIDAVFMVATREPGMAALLGELLVDFLAFQQVGVHLVGDGQRIAFHMRRYQAPVMAGALALDETMATVLSNAARRIGG